MIDGTGIELVILLLLERNTVNKTKTNRIQNKQIKILLLLLQRLLTIPEFESAIQRQQTDWLMQ